MRNRVSRFENARKKMRRITVVAMALNHRLPALLSTCIIFGAGTLLYAQMGPNDARLIPYQGTLEEAGQPADGAYDFRFALFSVEPNAAALDCLLADPPNCPLWSEEQTDVSVNQGQFAVALGDVEDVTDTMLAQSELYVGVAVKAAGASGFQRLGGTTRILPAAWASRAAAADDFTVAGEVSADAVTTNSLFSTGDIRAGGRLRADCPAGMNRITGNSAICIDATIRDIGVYNWYDTGTFCHNEGKRMCTPSEANVGVRSGATASFAFGTLDAWAWVDGVRGEGGLDHFACHANLNFDQGGTYLGEMNCQTSASVAYNTLGTLCCFEQ